MPRSTNNSNGTGRKRLTKERFHQLKQAINILRESKAQITLANMAQMLSTSIPTIRRVEAVDTFRQYKAQTKAFNMRRHSVAAMSMQVEHRLQQWRRMR